MFLINPSHRASRRGRKSKRKVPLWVRRLRATAMRNPPKRKRSKMKRRRARRRNGWTTAKRRRAGRKAARTRARKRAARRRSSRKSRSRSNPRRRRRAHRRSRRRARRVSFYARNPGRRSRRRSRSRRRGRRRSHRRRNPSLLRSATSSLRSATRPSTWKANIVDGVGISLGYAGVNALEGLEYRVGLDRIAAMIPGGIARTLWDYFVKIVNIGFAQTIARMLPVPKREQFVRNVRYGGLANFGVRVLGDVSGMLGGPGATVRGYLQGVGDYSILGAPGATAMNPAGYGMGNYMTAAGVPLMPDVSLMGLTPYGTELDGSLGY